MLRLLFNSDRIMGTSAYSKVTYELCTRSVKLGYKVAHIPMANANRMGKQFYQGVLVYPSGRDAWNEDVIVDTYVDWKADMLITLKDPWVFRATHKWSLTWAPYAIIDHSPVSPLITSKLHTAFRILVPSRFCMRELVQAGFSPNIIKYVPHGVRTDLYKPLDKKLCKKLFYLNPDHFVVGIVAMNRARKQIPRMLRAYKRFLELNPDVKSTLMLWTNVYPTKQPEHPTTGVADVGVHLLPEIGRLNLGDYVHWPDWKDVEKLGGLPEYDPQTGWDMPHLYNSMDVLLMTTGGEAFCLPLIEAQATGCPVVTTDYAGGVEQVGAGLTVKVADWDVINTPGTRYALADIDETAEALTKIMNADSEKLARKARRFAERYDWNRIISRFWIPFLEECETELKPLVTSEGVKSWA